MRYSQAKNVLFFNELENYSNLTVIYSSLKMLHQCNIWCIEGIGNKPSDSKGSWTFIFRFSSAEKII